MDGERKASFSLPTYFPGLFLAATILWPRWAECIRLVSSGRDSAGPGRVAGCAETEPTVHQPSSTTYTDHVRSPTATLSPVVPRNRPAETCVVARKALEIIQRNERGRQGKQRALLLKELREEEKKRRIYDATDQLEMDPEIAAANIQVIGIDALGRISPNPFPFPFLFRAACHPSYCTFSPGQAILVLLALLETSSPAP